QVQRSAPRHLGRRDLVPPGVRGAPEPALSSAGGLRAERGGVARLPGLPGEGGHERTGPVRDRRPRRRRVELRLAGRDQSRCGRDPSRARGARVMSTTQWAPVLTVPVMDERDHIAGPAGAPVTLVEYGDYECPYCGAAYPIVKVVQARMGEKLRFVFRNFPITTSHPHAEHAAEAAEAAAAQGRFWEMHDYLYEHQRGLTDKDLH